MACNLNIHVCLSGCGARLLRRSIADTRFLLPEPKNKAAARDALSLCVAKAFYSIRIGALSERAIYLRNLQKGCTRGADTMRRRRLGIKEAVEEKRHFLKIEPRIHFTKMILAATLRSRRMDTL